MAPSDIHDELMDEIKGSKAKIEQLEKQQYDHTDPKETQLKGPPAPASVRMDAKHATRHGGKGYKILVRGQYYAVAPDTQGKKVHKPYSIEVNVPSLDKVLSVLKNKLLPALLPRKYPEFTGLRTYNVVEVTPLSPASPPSTNLSFAPREVLEQYAQEHRVPINLEDYKDLVVLRATLVDFAYNPKGFEEREAKRRKDRAETAELAEMNPDLNTADVPGQRPGEAVLPELPPAPAPTSAK